MRGGYTGHVLVFVVVVRSVVCFFVFAVCVLLIAMIAGVYCSLFRVVMYALRFSWPCLGVAVVVHCVMLLIYLCWLCCLLCLFCLLGLMDVCGYLFRVEYPCVVSLGHVQVFVIGFRYGRCFFVFAMSDGCCCYLCRVVVFAWRLYWSCIGVFVLIAVRILICLCVCAVCVFVSFARFDGVCVCYLIGFVMYALRFSWYCIGVSGR